jgi:L,D-peptidoglycan transpeptidase YkuD (ErfK/YbiS/YcfS/YnhG family)
MTTTTPAGTRTATLLRPLACTEATLALLIPTALTPPHAQALTPAAQSQQTAASEQTVQPGLDASTETTPAEQTQHENPQPEQTQSETGLAPGVRSGAGTASAGLGGSGKPNTSTASKGRKAIDAAAKKHSKRLGKATSSTRCGLANSGCSRTFKGGRLFWSPKTGAQPVWGSIGSRYSKLGSQKSTLGYPKAAEKCGLKAGGCRQVFTGGEIHWSKKTGAHATTGTIHSTWVKNKRQAGKYGYPTAAMKVNSNGRWSQKFQHGTITSGIIRKGLPHGIVPDGGRQLIIASTAKRSSTRGEVQLWSLNNSGTWKRDHRFKNARYGYRGLATASAKREGDGKTPMGQYKVPFAFGNSAKPKGTKIEYRRVAAKNQWCSKSSSKQYNTWMKTPNKSCPAKGSEVLSRYRTQYAHSLVVDYNAKRAKNRGSAIFMHVNGKGSTAGCVSVTKSQMATTMKWLDPKKNPRIIIAPTGELKRQ